MGNDNSMNLQGGQEAPAPAAARPKPGVAQRVLAMVAASFGLLCAAGDVAAQPSVAAGGSQSGAAAFQKQAADLGVQSCAALFATLGDSLTRGATFASAAQGQKDSANDHAATAVVGLRYDTPNYKAQAAGIVATSPTSTGCEGHLVRVAPFPQGCPDIVKQLPPGSTLATTLAGTPLFTLGGNQGQALLVSSGNGCVVVTVASAMDRR
ncbi:hypothetical protein [Cupriavidus sp. AU9028]|uniref:hypothetical protein n=1 Tax=Cupriavidus sp. AU9028 TaxID=2871157 RepID=UPI001C961AD9|nr:hypothetical protein [Cupriavidus sp. AU9028]MBY4899366.1 hypothetical protein [Cupriavidus sp. AU9028]